jgi:hypothetical protein
VSEVLFIFAVGISGVFICMAMLYSSIRFTALVIDNLVNKKEEKEEK